MERMVFALKRIFIFVVFLLAFVYRGLAQHTQTIDQTSESPFWQDVRYGGSLGLSFGTGFFMATVAPSAIYDFNRNLSAGVGLNAAYSSQDNYKATSFGGSLIGMIRPIREIQVSTEFEQLRINRRYDFNGGESVKDKYWIPALFLGIGYNTGQVIAGFRYDVLHDSQRSFYRDALMPFVRVYF